VKTDKKILTLFVILCLSVPASASTTLIKLFTEQVGINYGSEVSPGLWLGGTVFQTRYFYSSESALASNNPFNPQGGYTPIRIFEQIIETRFRDVNGIPGTMIVDEIDGSSGLRPFFSSIDTEVLVNLTDWVYDGSYYIGFNGYTVPPASGTFNQSEQRFYLSDGRQYQVVPEPSSLSLLALGGVVVALGRRKRA